MELNLNNVLAIGLFILGGGLVALMVTVTQLSYRKDRKSEHWVVYPTAERSKAAEAIESAEKE
ncbi:MAG TPA: hypothetical protein VFU12_09075 [Glycomyces sp.]|nr:hypothetical protein [Glycomyces sp.]